ncbi:hypothetical protein JYK00_07310 [Thermosipho ferrireducens]|uniref:Uncharacterized protein n=1 Tax=Thermosipho ferrireducens TaxID=2571116 RepID=A0ABX7S6Y0_9BACT|nr:DUF5700 domain-containing putative Zn-dependent protease [Thermosipho ferrireducens]QTA37535.1 hypothetical protein JYK00_07310 [Thermosipho ferrireducens]
MDFKIRYSTVKPMLELCQKLKDGKLEREELNGLLSHEDYEIEFERYEGRVSKNEFIEYFLNLMDLTEKDICNEDLKIHHKYYKDLLDNLEFYVEKNNELSRLTPELFKEQIEIALRGLPDDINLPDLNFIFTIGIGQSFGYVHKNNMHFDFLQLVKNMSIDDFCASIAHEVHHVGMNLIYENIDINTISLEELFYLYFSGEGLAVKYCNNAEGVLSKSIYDGPKNVGLDSFTWEYLNNDFDNTMRQFKKTIEDIRNNVIKSREELEKHIAEYWMNPYMDGQSKDEIPRLKHFRLYSFGNDIWGIIHDCFGKETVYDTVKNPGKFKDVYNSALEKLGREEYKI